MNKNTVVKIAVVCVTMVGLASMAVARVPYDPLASVPNATGRATEQVATETVQTAVLERNMPVIAAKQGESAAWERVATDPVQRAKAVGHAAEEDFAARNPKWNLTAKPNAPQNDAWTITKNGIQGTQIKTHADGNPTTYMNDMVKDAKAEYFMVPDDQYDATRQRILDQIELMKKRGNPKDVARWQEQLKRLKPLGRSYAALDQAVLRTAKMALRNARIVRAVKTGGAGGGLILVLEGGAVVYRGLNGELTPEETREQLCEVGTKAAVVTVATGAVVLLGANPVGLTVLVVGGVTYLVADFAITEKRENWVTTPLTVAEINAALPKGWTLADAGSGEPLHVNVIQPGHALSDIFLPEISPATTKETLPGGKGAR